MKLLSLIDFYVIAIKQAQTSVVIFFALCFFKQSQFTEFTELQGQCKEHVIFLKHFSVSMMAAGSTPFLPGLGSNSPPHESQPQFVQLIALEWKSLRKEGEGIAVIILLDCFFHHFG